MKDGFDRLRGAAAVGAMGLGMLSGGGTARAATTSLSIFVTRALAATTSGLNLSVSYQVSNFSIQAFSIFDTSSSSLFTDGFDGVLSMTVGGNGFSDADGIVDLTGDTVTSDVLVDIITGIDAQVEFTFFSGRNTTSLGVIRALYTLTNTSGVDITTDVDINGNYASNTSTEIQATANGNLINDASDLWLYSNDQLVGVDPVFGNQPGLTLSRYGTGAAVVPTTIDAIGGGLDIFTHRYNVTVPAGETRRVLVFIEGSATNADAVLGAADFETITAASAAGLTTGLTTTQLDEIVNYAAGGSVVSSGGGSALGLPGLMAALGSLALVRRRRAKQAE